MYMSSVPTWVNFSAKTCICCILYVWDVSWESSAWDPRRNRWQIRPLVETWVSSWEASPFPCGMWHGLPDGSWSIMKYQQAMPKMGRLDCCIYIYIYIYIYCYAGPYCWWWICWSLPSSFCRPQSHGKPPNDTLAVFSPMANLRMTPFKERLELPKAGVPIRPNVSAGWMRILAEKLKQSRQSSRHC